MTDDDRDADRKKDEEIAEQHLANERRPVQRQESADAADRESHHQTGGKGEPDGNHAQAIVHGLQRQPVEAAADPRRCPTKQPFNTKAECHENNQEQQHLDPPALAEFRGDEPGGSA